MDRPRVEIHPAAIAEARSAREWYEERNPEAAKAFAAELDLAVAQIAGSPLRWPEYLHGTRQYLFRRFPYVAVYRETADVVKIVAIAHARRKPGYWRHR